MLVPFIVVGPADSAGLRPLIRAGTCPASDLDLQKQSPDEDVMQCQEADIEALWGSDSRSDATPDMLIPSGIDARTGKIVPPVFGTDSRMQAVRQAESAQQYLAETDWYVIRSVERKISMPADVAAARAAALASIEAAKEILSSSEHE